MMKKLFALAAFMLLAGSAHADSLVGKTFSGTVKDGYYKINCTITVMSDDSCYFEFNDRWSFTYGKKQYHFAALSGTGLYDPKSQTVSFFANVPRYYPASYDDATSYFKSMTLTFSFKRHSSSRLLGSFKSSATLVLKNNTGTPISGSTNASNIVMKKK